MSETKKQDAAVSDAAEVNEAPETAMSDAAEVNETPETAVWNCLRVRAATEALETVCAVMSMVDPSLLIEDYSDVKPDEVYGELIDERVLNADRTHVSVSVYLPAERSLPEAVAFVRERLADAGVEAEFFCEGVREEDWAETWKQYYHPVRLGRVTVVPAWEDYTPAAGEAIVRMDPGMAFGTGTHETTRLATGLLSDVLRGGERVLDIGTGSGILAIAASRLGASFCAAYDLDPVAVRVAQQNARDNGADNVVCGTSDLLRSVDLSGGRFDLMLANIVADILLRLAPDAAGMLVPGGRLIASGIIEPRLEEVKGAFAAGGFTVEEERKENDWYALLCRRA